MKLYSKNTGKFTLALGLGLMIAVLCASLLFGGGANSGRQVFADETVPSATTTIDNSLEGFTPNTLSTDGTTYLITSVDDLRSMAYYVNKGTVISDGVTYASASYKLTCDLDLSKIKFWVAIGTEKHPFTGVFNGNGYSIYGLTIIEDEPVTTEETQSSTGDGDASATETTESDESLYTYRGLFGYVTGNGTQNTEIKNLGLKDTLIKSYGYYTGGLVAYAEGVSSDSTVKISECYNTGYVEGSAFVGGLAGEMINGAYMKDCYFTGTVLDLDRFNSGVVNTTFDVATNANDGFVGGLAGFVTNTGTTRVIETCYSASRVGGASELTGISRGALVGNVGNGQVTASLKMYNFFSSKLFTTNTTIQGGKAFGSSIKGSNLEDLHFDVDCASTSTNSYLPDNPAKTWQWSGKVNNGFPFLKNTQQLVRIEFVNQNATNNNAEITDSQITSKIVDNAEGEKIVRLTNTDNNKTRYFVRIVDGVNLTFTTEVESESDADYTYQFSNWENGTLKTFFNASSTSTMAINVPNSATTTSVPDKDKVFVANYVEREYNVSITANGDGYAQDLSVSANTVKFYTTGVTVSATANSGYYLTGFATPLSSGNYVDENRNLNVAEYIKEIGKSADGTMPTTLNVVANFAPESYSIYTLSNQEGCSGYVMKGDTKLTNGSIIKYNDTLLLVVDPDEIATNYKFNKWEYLTVDEGSQPDASSVWTEVPNPTGRDDSISFNVPDLQEGQSLYFRANFKLVSYKVSLTQPNDEEGKIELQNNGGTAISDYEFDIGTTVYIAIKANTGYKFNSVVINGQTCGVGNNGALSYPNAQWEDGRIVMQLYSDTTISVNFEKKEYQVSVSLATLNYSSSTTDIIDNSNNKSLLYATKKVLYGSNLVFSVALEEGFEIKEVTSNTKVIEPDEIAGYVATITGDTDIVVTISKKKYVVTTSFEYDYNYDYSVDESCIHGAGTYYYGSNVAIDVDLPDMFEIVNWKWTSNGGTAIDNNTATNNGRDAIKCDYGVVIKLKLKEAKITFGQLGDNHDTTSGWYTIYAGNKSIPFTTDPAMSEITVKYGDIVRLQVDSQYNDGQARSMMYNFAYWQINNKAVSQNKEYKFTVNQPNIHIEAVYKPAQIAITTSCYEFDNSTEKSTLSSKAGSVVGLNASTASYGTLVRLEAKASDGYKFIKWENAITGATLTGSGVDGAVYQFTALTKTDIRAVFIKVGTVNLICDANAGVVSGAKVWNVGDNVEVNATAKAGYRFVSWNKNGTPVATTNKFEFTMPDANVTLTAEFERLYSIGYSTNDNSLGQIVGNTSGSYKENVTLEAISANNCSFVGWMVNDVLISNSTKLNISLNGDIEVQALFKKNFDWNIIIVILGSAIFVLVMIYGAIAYIKSREAQPVGTRPLIGSKDDSDIIRKSSKHNALRDEIVPVPTRKIQRVNVQPIPVRKIAVEPTDHKGNKVKPSAKAKDKKATLKTEE